MIDILSCLLSRIKKSGCISPEELRKNGEDYPENSDCSPCFFGAEMFPLFFGAEKGVII